ncbi:beta-lactamase family protein [Myxococcota bacterium]|nr:beta-lactamase family protein [Myxococcota bacterium]MBU1410467.1 beta-lactamase family protein [Myxococcota bacterium]MBU1510344.1 beta-lactamase family protein [Myxococcota bacterium]
MKKLSVVFLSIVFLTLSLPACGPTKGKTLSATPPPPVKAGTTAPPASPPAAPVAPDAACTGPCTIATVNGATFPVPELFRAERRGNVIQLIEPDGQVQVSAAELEGDTCAPAVASAWKLIAPSEKWALDKAVTPPPTGGFDEVYAEIYVPAADKKIAQAIARRKGRRIWVVILRAPVAAVDRRAAQVMTFITGMKAPGVEEENLKDKPLQSIVGNAEVLRTFIRETIKATGVPGLSIAVVENGKIVFSEGYGVRELGKTDPVTPETLMMIGSVTKSLTTLMMGTLVDDGKLAWDKPVKEVYPAFALGDAKLTGVLTMEQLVCACAGLPRKDLPLILSFWGKTASDCLKELGGMKPSTGLKETFQYQNHMVAAGGFLSAHVLFPKLSMDKAYEKAMKERVFTPLGMKGTLLDLDAARKVKNHATPHSQDMDMTHRIVPLEHERFAAYIGPSGGVWSNVLDMARFVMTELAGGVTPEGKRVISEKNLLHRRAPQVKMDADSAYGLGLAVSKSKGLLVVSHSGGTMGFATLLTFLPEKNAGLVMISNGTGGHLAEKAIQRRLVELWFGSEARAQKSLEYSLEQMKKSLAEAKARLSAPTAEFMAPFLGTLTHPELGDAVIAKVKEDYFMTLGKYRTRLMLYKRPDGKTVLAFTEVPLAGLELSPVEGTPGALELERAQERYVLTPKTPK